MACITLQARPGPDACCSAMLVSRDCPDGCPHRGEHEVSRHFGPACESPPPWAGTPSISPGPPEIGWTICFTRLPEACRPLSRIDSGLSQLDTNRILTVAHVGCRRIGRSLGAVNEPAKHSHPVVVLLHQAEEQQQDEEHECGLPPTSKNGVEELPPAAGQDFPTIAGIQPPCWYRSPIGVAADEVSTVADSLGGFDWVIANIFEFLPDSLGALAPYLVWGAFTSAGSPIVRLRDVTN